MTPNIDIKITVLTPKNQATKCVKTQRRALLGYKHAKQIRQETIEAHNRFSWILMTTTEEIPDLTKKCARGELIIKKFYHTLIKWIRRINRLANKTNKSLKYIRSWLYKRLIKEGQTNVAIQIQQMSDDELKEFISITDLKEMQALLKKELIKIEQVKNNGI